MMQAPMRVLFISHSPYLLGGAEFCLLELLEGLDREIVEPCVVLPQTWSESGFSASLGALRIPCFFRQIRHWVDYGLYGRLSRWSLAKGILSGLRARVWTFASLIERENIDIVYTNTVTVIEGALAARMTGRPHIWHIHEAICGNFDLQSLLPQPIVGRLVASLSNRAIFPSSFLAHRIYGYAKSDTRAAVMPNGVDHDRFMPNPSAKASLSVIANIPEEAPKIGIVGGLQARKRAKDFLHAAAISRARRQGAYFLMIGSGNEQDTQAVRALIDTLDLGSVVRPLGWRSDIADLIAGLDILVVSSEQETFGRTIIEAMSCGIPVVSTRCGGPEELVRDGETGLLVPVREPEKLAQAIDSIILDPSTAAKFGAAGREVAVKNFGLAQYVVGIQTVIAETMNVEHGRILSN
jgi:glycosyltransferase involved in cell wall biosynthesis